MLRHAVPAAGLLLLALLRGGQATWVAAPPDDAPAYTAEGNLVPPMNYREWIYLTSGIDMSYDKAATTEPAHSKFYNVFVNPSSYRSFQANGTWPDKTTMVLEVRGAENPVSINTRGHTQNAQIMGFEVHVKDHGKWAFYDLGGNDTSAKLIPPPADCYTCHEAHAAVDTTFVQFYPTLLPLAKQKKTLSVTYLKETAAPPPAAPPPSK